ncbi:MAG: antibiotic biosynthesis monooxygenase [Vicinamibacterales bacterium]
MSGPSEVVSVIRHRIRPGSEAAYEAWTQSIVPIAQAFAGHQGVAVIRPPHGSRLYTVVLHFDTLEHLRAWLESDTRQALLREIEPHLLAQGEVEIRPGLDFWLPAPGDRRAPPAKQFLLALSVIYPLVLIVPPLVSRAAAAAPILSPLPLRGLITATVIVGLMTWLIMPRYTRLVSGWLYGRS